MHLPAATDSVPPTRGSVVLKPLFYAASAAFDPHDSTLKDGRLKPSPTYDGLLGDPPIMVAPAGPCDRRGRAELAPVS